MKLFITGFILLGSLTAFCAEKKAEKNQFSKMPKCSVSKTQAMKKAQATVKK